MKNKPILACLPGLLCDERVWAEQTKNLTHLCEPKIIDLRPCSTLDEMIAKVNSVGDEIYLAGFSMGGYVAQEFFVRYPKKVKKIALISISATGYTPELKQKVQALANRAKAGQFDSLFASKLDQWLSSSSMDNSVIVDSILEMEKEAGVETYLRQTHATLERRDLREELDKHPIPALVVGGKEDAFVPENQILELANSLSQSECFVLEDCGHFVSLEKPEILTKKMEDWLLRPLT